MCCGGVYYLLFTLDAKCGVTVMFICLNCTITHTLFLSLSIFPCQTHTILLRRTFVQMYWRLSRLPSHFLAFSFISLAIPFFRSLSIGVFCFSCTRLYVYGKRDAWGMHVQGNMQKSKIENLYEAQRQQHQRTSERTNEPTNKQT